MREGWCLDLGGVLYVWGRDLMGGVSAWGRGLGRQGARGSLTVVVSERRVDEGRSRVEKDAEIESGYVVGLDAVVLDGHVAIVVRPGVHIPAAVRGVQHVCETRLLQPIAVQRRGPGRREKGRSVDAALWVVHGFLRWTL